MNRVTRMAIGLVALIPVLWFVGWLLAAVGVEGEGAAWAVFVLAAIWMGAITWWALRSPMPPQLTDEARSRYLAFLRHGRYRSLDEGNGTERTEVGPRR